MNHMPLLEHLKTLKAAMPQANKQAHLSSKLPIFKNIKDITKKSGQLNQGIFFNQSFCIPFIDPDNDPTPEKLTQIVRGIFMQGGFIVEFNQKMNQEHVKFLIISQKSRIQQIKKQISGYVKFDKILKYEFVLDSLKRLKLMDPMKYLLLNNEDNLKKESNRSELAKEKLFAEKINQNLLRPKLPEQTEESKNGEVKNVQEMPQKYLYKHPKQQTEGNQSKQERQMKEMRQVEAMEISNDNKEQLELKADQQSIQSKQTTSNAETTNVSSQIANIKPVPINNSPFHKEPLINKNRFKKTQQKPIVEAKPTPQLQKKQAREEPPQYKWEKKSDRRVVWFEPPKNLSSHNFKNNNYICDKFMELQQIYKRNGDIRSFSYVRAVATIKSHEKDIRTAEDLKQVKGLSNAMVQKAKELLQTGSIGKLTKYSRKEENIVCKQLQQVWGLGPKKAKEFYDMGIKTVEDLKKRPDLISKNMSVGLKYFQEFKNRLPRQKVTRIYELIKKTFFSLVLSQKTHFIQIVGSYRRLKQTCGDIDVLISRKDGSVQTNLLKNYIKSLEEVGFLTETLSQPRAYDGKNHTAFMGVCFFQEKHHRIDIKQYPIEQYPFALMYFTGSDLFNRQMRMRAHNKGLLLSDHGLRSKERNGFNKIWKGGQMPIFRCQQDIFKFLQFDYCKPSQRSI